MAETVTPAASSVVAKIGDPELIVSQKDSLSSMTTSERACWIYIMSLSPYSPLGAMKSL